MTTIVQADWAALAATPRTYSNAFSSPGAKAAVGLLFSSEYPFLTVSTATRSTVRSNLPTSVLRWTTWKTALLDFGNAEQTSLIPAITFSSDSDGMELLPYFIAFSALRNSTSAAKHP